MRRTRPSGLTVLSPEGSLFSMTTPPTNPHIEEHRRAGTIHIVEVVADLNRLLSAIQFELDGCGAPALVIDLIGDLCLTHGATTGRAPRHTAA